MRILGLGALAKSVLVVACLVTALIGYGCTEQSKCDNFKDQPETTVVPAETESPTGGAVDEAGSPKPEASVSEDVGLTASDAQFRDLFEAQANDVQVTGTGTVTRLLADDTEGDRHQRFIVALNSGQTLLIVHNIDIAPRIETLKTGDTVEFCGEYVYNDQGGLVHWTHHDPDGRHTPGYIVVNGQTYS